MKGNGKGLLQGCKDRARWRPGRLTDEDVAIVAVVLACAGLIRGFDYLTGQDLTDSLSVVEQAAPLYIWGAGFFIFGLILLAGVIFRWHVLVWLGHGLYSAMYALLGLGIFLDVGFDSWGDGVRTSGSLIALSILHWMLCARTGVRPLRHEEARPTEVVEGPG